MRTVGCAVLVAVAAVVVPTAHADPPRFPDLGGFAQVNRKDYATYSAYSTTGVQFGTPAGYRCRMTYTFKASVAGIDCWGSLPGTTHNHVSVVDSRGEAALDDVDLAVMERYRYIDGTGWHDGVVSPDAYRFLPTHSKVSDDEPSSRTCGVDGRMTACELPGWDGERHGFVLTPEGSWTF